MEVGVSFSYGYLCINITTAFLPHLIHCMFEVKYFLKTEQQVVTQLIAGVMSLDNLLLTSRSSSSQIIQKILMTFYGVWKKKTEQIANMTAGGLLQYNNNIILFCISYCL